MTSKQKTWRLTRIIFIVAMIIIIGLVGFGCVKGLAPIGWSGGTVVDGTLFVGSKEGRLVAITLADESRQWTEPLKATGQQGGFLGGCSPATGGGGCGGGSAGVAIYGTPVVEGDRIYMGGYNGKFYAYDVATLQMDDVYPPEGNLPPIVGGAAVSHGKVYFGDSEGTFYALNAGSLLLDWKFTTGDKIWSTPAVSGDTVYVGSFDGKLYALNAYDGTERWAFTAEGAIISTPLVHEDTVYVGSFDRHLYAINAYNGNLKWKFMGENWFWAQPVVYNDTLYAGCLDDYVYALKAASGAKVADFNLESPVSSAPVIVDSSIIFSSRKGIIYAIDTRSNEMRLLVDLDEEVNGPLTAHEEIVYIHTQDLLLQPVNTINGAVLRSISLKVQD